MSPDSKDRNYHTSMAAACGNDRACRGCEAIGPGSMLEMASVDMELEASL
jgi:hypothetical protein